MQQPGLKVWVTGALVVATLAGGWMHRQRQIAWVEDTESEAGGLALGGDPVCMRTGDALTVTFLDARAGVDIVVPATARRGERVPVTFRVAESQQVSSGQGHFVVDESGTWLGGRFEGQLEHRAVRGRVRVRVPELPSASEVAARAQ